MLTDAQILTHDRAVPRYTSYPTAPHFSPVVDAATMTGWLARTGETAQSLSLYIHIPFCRQICHYCGCLTRATAKDGPIHTYMGLLHRELDLLLGALGPRRPRVRHIHFGGGTPSLVAGRDLLVLMDRLHEAFPIDPDAEIAMEIDPRPLTGEQAQVLALGGVNRVSLGVQDLDRGVQQAIGRQQSAAVVERAIVDLTAAGITRLNLDLMVGLPRQTPETVQQTLAHVVAWAPDRIAVFAYAHVPWMRKHQTLLEQHRLPGAIERHRLAQTVAEGLRAAGYWRIGLDHFARPGDGLARAQSAGRLARNFQGYTDDPAEALIGLGVSSISSLPQGYAQSAGEEKAWRRALMAGRLPTVRGVALSADDRLRRSIIERLLCDLGVDLAAIAAAHRAELSPLLADAEALAPLVAEGLVVVDGAKVMVPEVGRPLLRLVAAAFDRYQARGVARHSRAI